ncbi:MULTISPECIES: cyanophycinase [Pseudoalteromonas]|uniref:cyanophycinase n=1 Tax=Pseudoalteromonas TaxID=53246 RepID=UPI000C338A1C|nr:MULTISPECIES: cyanophycinase [Pseudoalteromonas]PKG66337.1 cyanophycinase [Pseudoalteromonas arctica]PKG71322.1 cyanophycinase [Pseudoalteromonas sp. GutCa3]PLT25922.1 cyanophycinase [Pseudoalteromonas sp. MelDa3]
MICAFLRDQQPKLLGMLVALFGVGYSINAVAQEQNQTLILVGSELTTCTSAKLNNCQKETAIDGKSHNLYAVSNAQIKNITQHWPNNNVEAKTAVLKTLKTLLGKSSNSVSKTDLLWLWRDINNQQLESLTQQEYNFVFDMLEVPLLDKNGERLKEQVNTDFNIEVATNNILQFVSGSLKVNNAKPTILAITASSRDPYESADVAQSLLAQSNINTQWLALTPALAKAITSNSCDELPALRNTLMNVYNREAIYPEYTKAEYALCKSGTNALVSLIKNSTGVMFNSGNAALTHKVLFDQNNNPYPWTQALQTRPVIVGEGAGAAIQSKVTGMLTNTTSLEALRKNENNINAGGLGSFNFGVLDTQFSEQNRTFRLTAALNKNEVKNTKTEIQHGFGIDENTALVVIKSSEGGLITVIGKSGVVHLANQSKAQPESKSYSYSYWPTGSVIDITNNTFILSERTIDQALPAIKIPPLPVQRFGAILTNSKLRSLTQAMCLSQEQSAVAQQDEFIISLTATSDTQYHRVNAKEFGCALSNLELAIKSI